MDIFNHETLEIMPKLDVDAIIRENHRLNDEVERLQKILKGKILLVEDGSVDIDQLEEDGFYVIPYRQGSTPPKFLPHQHEDKGE